jgi:hypothetical protein
MDPSTLVEDQIYDGRRFIERFAADGNPVTAAFWVKKTEGGHWSLYVASELYESSGPAAYKAMHESLNKLGDSDLQGSIKVISPNNPIARDLLALMARYPNRRRALRLGDRTLGGMEVDHILIYPSYLFTFTQVNPMTTEEVGQQLLRLMNRGPGPWQPSRVTLKDGTSLNGSPFSLQLVGQDGVVVTFIADGEISPRTVRLDEIASVA